MQKEDFEKLKLELVGKGYKIAHQHWKHEDYVMYKPFHRDDNQFCEDRCQYQVMLSIYDWSTKTEYWDRMPEFERNRVGIEVTIGFSRIANERIDLILMWEDNTTIEEIEQKAESFFNWATKEWPEPNYE